MSKRLKTDHVNSVDIIPPSPKEEYTIDVLNPHCFANIFRYLSIQDKLNIEKVSEKCKDSSRFAWCDTKKLDLSNHHEPLPGQTIVRQALTRCGQYLTELLIGTTYDCRILTAVLKYCHNVVTLKLVFSGKFQKNFTWKENTFSKMTNLKSIELFNHSNEDLVVLNSLPDDIEKIQLTYNGNMYGNIADEDESILATNMARWKKLKSLSIEGLHINYNALKSIFTIETLTHLSMSYDRFSTNQPELLSILSGLPNLEYLNIQSLYGSQDCLIPFINNCTKLKHLNIAKSYSFSHSTLAQIGNFKNLEYLNMADLSKVDDAVINNIVINCKELKYLNISYCTKITNEALKKLSQLKNLEELLMNGTNVDDNLLLQLNNMKIVECASPVNRGSVTPVGILGIFQSSPNIQHVDISSTKLAENEIANICDIINNRENNGQLTLIVNNKLKFSFEVRIKHFQGLTLQDRICMFMNSNDLSSEEDDEEDDDGDEDEFGYYYNPFYSSSDEDDMFGNVFYSSHDSSSSESDDELFPQMRNYANNFMQFLHNRFANRNNDEDSDDDSD